MRRSSTPYIITSSFFLLPKMKLELIYNTDKKGYNLEADLHAEIKDDAEALGYITTVFAEASKFFIKLSSEAKPELLQRIDVGIRLAEEEKKKNKAFPFDKLTIIEAYEE